MAETSSPGPQRYVQDLPPCLHSLSLMFWPPSIFGFRSRAWVGALAGALAPLLAKLKFIYGPHCSLLALHSYKALVQAQVVADGILWKKDRNLRQGWGGQSTSELIRPESETDLLLPDMSSPRLTTLGAIPATSVYRGTHLPGGGVVSEVGEHASEPMVDFIECPLPLWSFQNGLEVRVRWNKGSCSSGCG